MQRSHLPHAAGLASPKYLRNTTLRQSSDWPGVGLPAGTGAMEKYDEDTARDLERVDPHIVERLRAAGRDVGDCPDERPSARRDRFGRLSDERYEQLAASFTRAART